MSNKEFQDARDNYRKKEGDYPPYGQQPTIEQCTVFMMFIIKHCVLYMDFAIWVPNGDRALMRRHFTSRQLDSKGNFTYVEVYGPRTFVNGPRAGESLPLLASCSTLSRLAC